MQVLKTMGLNKGSWGFKESITGWQASSGNIEIQKGKYGGTTGAADGSACLELDAHGGPDTMHPFSKIFEQG